MTDQLKITDLDLTAYIDGELEADRVRAVEEAVSRDASLAERIAAYRTDKTMLKRIYTPLAEHSIPPAWTELARVSRYPAARARHSSLRLVGAIAVVVLVALGGWRLYEAQHRPAVTGDVIQAALDARGDRPSAQRIVAVANIGEARRYDAALQKIVGVNVQVPALGSMGFEVAALKFYERAAEIQYRDSRGRIFTLYLRPSDGTSRFDQFERGGLRICVWQDDRISTVMAGTISAAMMQRLASLTYLGLSI